jgi:hypothetical protein
MPESSSSHSLLDNIEIATPCSASWNDMQGDERKRYCGDCKLHVFNLSAMTRGEAEDLLQGATGRVCARIFKRADGTLLTADCGPVRAAIRRRLRRMRVAASAMLGFFASLAMGCGGDASGTGGLKLPDGLPGPKVEHPEPTMGIVCPEPEMELMGDVALPSELLGKVGPAHGTPPPEAATSETPPGDVGATDK